MSQAADRDTGKQRYNYAELHSDGSGFVASPLWVHWVMEGERDDPQVSDQGLVTQTASALRFIADHPTHCGAIGDATAALTIVSPGAVRLVQPNRFHFVDTVPDSRPLIESVVSRHTVVLDVLQADPRELLHAVRMMVADVLQGFGVPETLRISQEGELRVRYFLFDQPKDWEKWAPGFPTTDATE